MIAYEWVLLNDVSNMSVPCAFSGFFKRLLCFMARSPAVFGLRKGNQQGLLLENFPLCGARGKVLCVLSHSLQHVYTTGSIDLVIQM